VIGSDVFFVPTTLQLIPAYQLRSAKDPDLKPLWDFLDSTWGGQTLEDGDQGDEETLESPPEDPMLAIEDGQQDEELPDGQKGTDPVETVPTKGEVSVPQECTRPEDKLSLSLKGLSISGPNEDRAKAIRAELIRPASQGGVYEGGTVSQIWIFLWNNNVKTFSQLYHRAHKEILLRILLLNPVQARACSSAWQSRHNQERRRN